MDLSLVIEKLDEFITLGSPVKEGDPCILWINGLVAYAYCYKIDPDYSLNWFNCYFYTLDRLPPTKMSFKITHDHLSGNPFTINKVPISIICLNLKDGSSEEIKEINWDDFLGGGRVP